MVVVEGFFLYIEVLGIDWGKEGLCLPRSSLRNVSCMRVQLWWGLLASGHSNDGELPLWAWSSLPLSDSLGKKGDHGRVGGGREGTPAELCDLSQGLKWDQIVRKTPFYCSHLLPV